MAKLKDLVKENFSLVGGVVSTPAINAGYGSLTQIVKEKYGEWILYDPGLNKNTYILWLLPILIFLIGGAIISKNFIIRK